jgi:hypothetical protein
MKWSIVAGAGGAALTAALVVQPANSVTSSEGVTHAAGAIQCGVNGVWGAISNDVHVPYGVGKVEVVSGRVRVWYTEPMTQVRVALVTPDETYTQKGVEVGASVGLRYTDLMFSRYGKAVAPGDVCFKSSNAWMEIKSP